MFFDDVATWLSGFPGLALADGPDDTPFVFPGSSPPVYPPDHEVWSRQVSHAHVVAFEAHPSVPWSECVAVAGLVRAPDRAEVAPQLTMQALKTNGYPNNSRHGQ